MSTTRLPYTGRHANNTAAAHSALDLLFAVLPVFLVWDLQLSTRVKLGIACLLSLGLFACACSIKKITETARLGAATDITWEFTDLSIWNMVELNVGIICGSLPCTRPLWQRVWYGGRSLVTSSGAGRSGTQGYGKNGSGYGRMGGTGNGDLRRSAYGEGTVKGQGQGHGRASVVGGGRDGETYMMRSGLKHAGGKGGVTTSRIRGGDDADSEENILPMHGGIMQTTEVEVKYDGSVVTDGEDDAGGERMRDREGSGSGLSADKRAVPRGWGEAR